MSDTELAIGPGLFIPRHELEARATRSGGPGGQHVNTSSTRVEVRWNVRESAILSDEQRARIESKLGKRIDERGFVRVVSSDSRSQKANRERAETRLAELIRKSLIVPRKRRATSPTKASVEKRISEKKHRSAIKRDRRAEPSD